MTRMHLVGFICRNYVTMRCMNNVKHRDTRIIVTAQTPNSAVIKEKHVYFCLTCDRMH